MSQAKWNVRALVKVGILSALAFALMILEFPLPIFPAFLRLDVSDLPALLGGFALGPIAGIVIEFIKNVFHFILKNDGTGGVGNLANFIVGVGLVVPATGYYRMHKNIRGALVGMGLGVLGMVVLSSLANWFVLIPAYTKLMPLDTIISMAANTPLPVLSKHIVDIRTYVLWAVIPFNLIKALLASLVTYLVYKPLSPLLHR